MRTRASLYELPPGASSFPLHIHHANEELIVVLSGRPSLRGLDGERELPRGMWWPVPRAVTALIDSTTSLEMTLRSDAQETDYFAGVTESAPEA